MSHALSPVRDHDVAWDMIYDYRVNNSPPPAIAAYLDTFLKGASIPYASSEVAELAFALRATAPKDFLAMAANVATCAFQFAVGKMHGARGEAIYQALAREAGMDPPATGPWPLKTNDPPPKPDYDPARQATKLS